MKPTEDTTPWLADPPVRTPVSHAGGDLAKRITDITLASLSLVALAPIWTAVAIAIRLESAGPVLFQGERVGRGGVRFRMFKFRKMRENASGPALTTTDDVRFTRIGKFLARTKLDELPQLLNVLRGEMSVVGPRPEDPKFVELAGPAFRPVLRARPGITGLSQVHFAREHEHLAGGDPEGAYIRDVLPRKIAMDTFYAENRTWLMDIKIIAWTGMVLATRLEVVLPAHGADVRVRRVGSSACGAPGRQEGVVSG